MQDAVLGPDPEQVDEGRDDGVERPVRDGDRLGAAGGARGEEHVRRVVERLSVERGDHRLGVVGRVGGVDRAVGPARGPAPEQRHHGVGIVDGRDGHHAGPVPQRCAACSRTRAHRAAYPMVPSSPTSAARPGVASAWARTAASTVDGWVRRVGVRGDEPSTATVVDIGSPPCSWRTGWFRTE